MTNDSNWPEGAVEARLIDALHSWSGTHPGETTSSITGTGAVAELENWFARRVGHLRGFAVASGTQALQGALLAAGVNATSSVALPAYDWPAALAATLAIGASPIWCDVGVNGVITPATASDVQTPDVIVATDLHGYPVDVVGVRAVLPGVTIIEDCTQAIGAERDGRPAGSDADIAVWSLGHGKFIDAGEGGVITTGSETLAAQLVATTYHPVRQAVAGGPVLALASIARIHPAAALLAVAELASVDERVLQASVRRFELVAMARSLGVRVPEPEHGVRPSPAAVVALESRARLVSGVSVGELAYPEPTTALVGERSPEGAALWSRLGRRVTTTNSGAPCGRETGPNQPGVYVGIGGDNDFCSAGNLAESIR